MELRHIEDALQGESFLVGVRENVSEWKEGFNTSQEVAEEIETWFHKTVGDFIELLKDVEDEGEFGGLLFSHYVELKCQWKKWNAQIQYQNFKSGMPDVRLVAKASLLTYILIAIEPLLHKDDIQEIQQFLTKPIREILLETPNPDSEMPEMVKELENQLSALYYDKEKLFHYLGTCEPAEVVLAIQNMQAQVNDLKKEFEDICIVEGNLRFSGKRRIVVKKS